MLYEKCQLSKEQVGFFHHNGYLVADGLYTEGQIDQLEQAYEVSIPGRMRRGLSYLRMASTISTIWLAERPYRLKTSASVSPDSSV